jgi:hypothetical protein
MVHRLFTGVLALTCLVGASCTIDEELARPPAEIEVESVPPGIESSAHDVYRGHDVYWVNEHWYYRHGRGWVYLDREPGELRSRRERQGGEGQVSPSRGAP